jgi:hypothetical protein
MKIKFRHIAIFVVQLLVRLVNMGSGNLFAISFPGGLGRNSFLVMKNKLPVPIAFFIPASPNVGA